jgi:endo-1,4-beta-xylanase
MMLTRVSHDRFSRHVVPAILWICLAGFGSRLASQPLAAGHDKFLGNVFSGSPPASFVKYWNQVTPENAGKWGSVEYGRDMYDWGGLDMAYNYALQNGFTYKHHTLIWGQQAPFWIAYIDSASQAEEIEEWIRLVAERYPKMNLVDVVNEPLHAPPTYYMKGMGGSGATGWDWVIWAFTKARKYFPPTVKLILNEYSILHDDSRTDQLIGIVNLLKSRSLVDAIGIQGHYFEFKDQSTAKLKYNLDRLAATGLPVYISEFDVNLTDDNAQLQKYKELFPLLWEHPAVKGITLWGYIQGSIWQTGGYLVRSDRTERPALGWLRTYLSSTGIQDRSASTPKDFGLDQNFPNPFNPSTTIRYRLGSPSRVQLAVYNVKGVKIRTLVDAYQNEGAYTGVWNSTDDMNRPVPSGMYFYRLTADGSRLEKSMLMLR